MRNHQALRDYLDWKKSLFLPLPAHLLENLKSAARLSQTLIQEISFSKNPDLFPDEKRQNLLALLNAFDCALKPKSGGENEITKLSAIAGEIMEEFRKMDYLRTRGKIVLREEFIAPFWESLSAWNGILSQFRWIERTISAYIGQIEAEEDAIKPEPFDIKTNIKQLLKALPR